MSRVRTPVLAALLFACGCNPGFKPYSLIRDLSVLAVKADPPELGPRQSAHLQAVVVDPQGRTLGREWDYCVVPASVSLDADQACAVPPVDGGTPGWVTPIGTGDDATVTMPALPPQALGLPDETDGLYLPVRLIVTTGDRALTTIYPLRFALIPPPNHNPRIADVLRLPDPVSGDEGGPLADGTPVHAGAQVALRGTFADGSAETYLVFDTQTKMPTMRTEVLRASWFATHGSFSQEHTGTDQPDTVLQVDADAPVGPLDVWLVLRDDRGGTDFLHRALVVE
jgi:hypothetical protein